jgi:glutamyl-tRNA reductase
MSLLALGINHQSAPLALRERLAFSAERSGQALNHLAKRLNVEAVIISTCNRTELYCNLHGDDPQPLIQWLCEFQGVDEAELMDALYLYHEEQAVRHLMRVASGLDSLILGEPQILGQVKQAFTEAKEAGVVGTVLDRWFQRGFSAAKLVRTETDIGTNAVSVAYAAVSLAKRIFGELEQARVLLIGAGETIELVARHLWEQGVSQITVANRTITRGQALASQFDAQVITLNEIPQYLHQADIVISSTAAPLPILGKGMVEEALKVRRHQPMFMVDIAVPRDIEPQVGELPDIYLYCVDDLQGIIEQNIATRREAAHQAEALLELQAEEFMRWLRSLDSVATIRDYRSDSERIRDALVEKTIDALRQGQDVEIAVRELAFKLTNKLIHAPTQAITRAGEEGRTEVLEVIRDAIGLDKS